MTSSLERALDRVAREFELDVGKVVVDLGAGRGERSRRLSATGARVIAIDPSAAARAELAGAVATVEIVEGTADHLPLPEWTADLVVVAAAADWLDEHASAAEVHRVLRPGGGLVVLAEAPPTWSAAVRELFGPPEEREDVHWCRKA